METIFIFLTLTFLPLWAAAASEKHSHWWDSGKTDIQRSWNLQPNLGVPKNEILMIGDGMGITTITAGRIYIGQQRGESGEEYQLNFETFPHVGLSKTYNVDRQVADSAGTASALASGYKVNYGTLGVSSEVPYGQSCQQFQKNRKLTTVLDYALQEGKSVGLVTNTRITHATPGAFYAHTPWRDWENDAQMASVTGCEQVPDIASQLVKENPNIHVVLGGGRGHFLNTTAGGFRAKGDLVEEWKRQKASQSPAVKYQYVESASQLRQVDTANTDYLFGLFAASHMSYEIDRDNAQEPSLSEMVKKAIEILDRNPKGFFLMVEGGRIDHAHHENFARKSLHDVMAFDDAVKTVTDMTSQDDTLLIVTADHAHVFTMAGYPSRGNDILGTVDIVTPDEMPVDNKPYLTLGYANGPSGLLPGAMRPNYTNIDNTGKDATMPAYLKMNFETHGGQDVAIYARGPMSHLIHSTHEQSYIGHVLMYSACLGNYKDNCDREKRVNYDTCDAVKSTSSALIMFFTTLAIILSRML